MSLYGEAAEYATDYVDYEKEIKAFGKAFWKIQTPALEMSANTVRTLEVTTRLASKGLGIAGVAIGGYDMIENGVNVSNTLDVTMSALMLTPSGVGQAIGGGYFIINAGVTYRKRYRSTYTRIFFKIR
ncbi:hypothetical protein [Elizabethkingia anophelis]|uniref:hypothetical protein n=1 Tax=Elizabethkingia anophelis TaxID=1117645 RepID=UPI001370A0B2|nr:hypothetical protein [Elizabethkingia anophelis]MYY44012.1 hypothetical protein [Elizabethkingia anophelis]